MDCKICYEKFDKIRFKPVICIPCAHTFCASCGTHINECSICRTKIFEKKPNFNLQEIIEDTSKIKTTIPIKTSQTRSGAKFSHQKLKHKIESKSKVKNQNRIK